MKNKIEFKAFLIKIFDKKQTNEDVRGKGCALGCYILRRAAKKAFEERFYSLTAPNIIEKIGEAFKEFFKEEMQAKAKF